MTVILKPTYKGMLTKHRWVSTASLRGWGWGEHSCLCDGEKLAEDWEGLRPQGEGGLVSSKPLQMSFVELIVSVHSSLPQKLVLFILWHHHINNVEMLGHGVQGSHVCPSVFSPFEAGSQHGAQAGLEFWSSCQVLGRQACTHSARVCNSWDILELLHTFVLVCAMTFEQLSLACSLVLQVSVFQWFGSCSLVAWWCFAQTSTEKRSLHTLTVCMSYLCLHCKFLKKGPSLSLSPNSEQVLNTFPTLTNENSNVKSLLNL